ncbi:NADH dehydrogenase ubiquinone Fe-S protein 4 [Novosphingobium barchaimii]|nr:NADH dehydrogenase ubiquinone Fe-S protein 4 [Novosphingobium barchaimii]
MTGWTSGGDPLAQFELSFPDLEAAQRYCRREGVRFKVHGGA